MLKTWKQMSKRTLSLMMVIVLMMSMVPALDLNRMSNAQANTNPTVTIGDYVQFGKFNDAPILWRVIHKDANGDPVLFADRVLTLKAFDAKGSYHTGVNARVNDGSSYYPDSNIRQWLNSSSNNSGATTIDWIQNDPIAANLTGNNPYNTEKGFLADSNFSSSERGLLKSLTHKVLLHDVDGAKKTGGTTNYQPYHTNIADVVQNYDDVYYKDVTDSVFLLSVKHLKEYVYDNRSVLGNNYHLAKPTPQAATIHNVDGTMNRSYWLNTPHEHPDSSVSGTVRFVSLAGAIDNARASTFDYGVRPALMVNWSAASVTAGGAGTSANPYVITAGSGGSADTTVPSAPSNVSSSNVSATGLTLTWTASTDNVGVTAYEIYNGATLVATVTGSGGSAPATTYNLTGLTAGTSYSFTIKAKDAAGNASVASTAVSVTTTTGSDTQAPAKPTGLASASITDTTVQLSWNASTDNNGVTAYEIFQGTTKIATVTGNGGAAPVTTYEITGLTANTKYTFTVKAIDAAGNVSASSPTMTVTTMKADAQAPTKPAGLSFSSVSSDTVTLTWTASTDNFGVTAYEVYEGATLFETITVTDSQNSTVTYQVTNLQPGSNYTFYVKAKDAAGISSEASTPIRVTTTDPENQAPTAIRIDNNSIDENSWLGFTVGTLTATDADAGDTFTYALVEGEGDTDNASFTIVGDKLKVASELDYIEDYTYSICVQVTDDGGLSYSQMIEIDVTQANVLLNDAYNQLTVYFEENFLNNKATYQTLKSEITMTSNAEAAIPTYSALPEGASVSIRTNTLIIKFSTPLPATTANYRIKIAALALRDAFNNKSQEQISSPFSIDGEGPKVVSVKVNKKKNFITIRFNKNATIASEGINLKAKQMAFKNAIQLKRTGGNYAALGTRDVVKLSGRVMTIKLASVLTTTSNDLKIAANQLQDIGGNKSGELNMKVDLDTTGPMIHKVTVVGKNKVIQISFKDGALNAFSGPTRLSLLKAAVKFSTDGGVNYAALAETDKVELLSGNKNGLMMITLATAISGTQNRVRINTDALKDSFKNLNTMLETSLFAVDEIGPIHLNTAKQVVVLAKSSNKSIAVNFNERVFNGSTATKPAERLAALKSAITYTLDADADSPTYVPLIAKDKITFRGKQLRITLSKSLPSDKKFRVKIAEGIIADQVGNTTLAIETEKFETDKSGPRLR